MTRMVLAPGKGLGSCRAGNGEDLVVPLWAVATCNSFWSGERSSLLPVEKETEADLS